MIDNEVFRILHEQEARAHEILLKHRTALDSVAEDLLERETIDGASVARLVQAGLGDAPSATEDVTNENHSSLAD
jgi:cell division protease FtsH